MAAADCHGRSATTVLFPSKPARHALWSPQSKAEIRWWRWPEAEISPALARPLAGHFGSSKRQEGVSFPHRRTSFGSGDAVASGVQLSAPIELLCEAAGMRLEATPRVASTHQSAALPHQANAGETVQVAPALPPARHPDRASWDNLTLRRSEASPSGPAHGPGASGRNAFVPRE